MNKLYRSFIALFSYLLFAAGAIIIGYLIFPLIKLFFAEHKKIAVNLIQKLWFLLIKYLEILRIIKVNFPKEISDIRNKIIVASHPTYIDIVILIALIPGSVCIAKNSLLKNPIMKNIVEMLYITNDYDIDTFKQKSKEALQQGFNIIIFPAGGRTDAYEDIRIHKGAALIAIENDVPIIPVKITVNQNFLKKNKSMIDLGEQTAVFDLKLQLPIIPSQLKEPQMSDIVLRNKICALIKEKI